MTKRALIFTHDIFGIRNGIITRGFSELYKEKVYDGREQLVFRIPFNHPKEYLLALDTNLLFEGIEYFIYERKEMRNGSILEIEITAPASWYRLGQNDFAGQLQIEDLGVYQGLSSILPDSSNTGWVINPSNIADFGDEVFSMEEEDKSYLDLIRTWAKITGAYPVFNTTAHHISMLPYSGSNLGLQFRKGRNLRNLVRRKTPPEVTQLIPEGKDGVTIGPANDGFEMIEDFSFYTSQGMSVGQARSLYTKRKRWTDTNFVTPRDLKAGAQRKLSAWAQSIQHVELDVVDISEITGVAEDFTTGDFVTAYDPDLDEEFQAMVVRMKEYPLDPAKNSVELEALTELIDDPSSSRGQTTSISQQWIMIQGPIQSVSIRSDVEVSVAEIAVETVVGAKCNFHVDVWFTGVGDGTAHARVVDIEADDYQQYRIVSTPYADGVTTRITFSWSLDYMVKDLKTYQLWLSTTADGGPDAGNGIDTLQDAQDPLVEAGFWIMAYGLAKGTPTIHEPSEYDLYLVDLPEAIWYMPVVIFQQILRDNYDDELDNAGPPMWLVKGDQIT